MQIKTAQELLGPLRKISKVLGLLAKIKPSENPENLWFNDTLVCIQNETDFREQYRGEFSAKYPFPAGYCLDPEKNKNTQCKEARVLKKDLGKTLSTTCHEIGHLFTSRISDRTEEEAKAYAFQYAACQAAKRTNLSSEQIKSMFYKFLTNPKKGKFQANFEGVTWVRSLIGRDYQPNDAMGLYWDIVKNRVRSVPA